MVIKTSSGKLIDRLIAGLSADSPVTVEAAVARLTVIGTRAVERLTAVVDRTAPPSARIAALRTLEAIADPRALVPVFVAMDDRDMGVASAAISTARRFLRSARGADVVDHLTRIALDVGRPESLRLIVIHALDDLEPTTLRPLWTALAHDPSPAVRASAHSATSHGSAAPTDPVDDLTAAAERDLPDDPVALRHVIARAGPLVALPLLHRIVERVRERETAEPPDRRPDWTTTRAAAHLALAHRGSRLALYDLRESLEAARAPLPVEFLAALSIVGDSSCLEAIAAAYARTADSGRAQMDWWRQHLASAFHAIVKRNRITRRHAVLKKIAKRWGDLPAPPALPDPPAL